MSLKLGSFRVTSPAFGPSGRMDKKYGGDAGNKSPPLEWSGAPKGTKEFALVCHDPDAPLPHGFTHWVLYGIPASVTRLSEGQGPDAFVGGVNGTHKAGYMGPYPPNGHGVHHYYFWIYALGKEMELGPGLARSQLLDAISDSILEQARLVGTYER
ncbi:MAG: YbhB/YbcL family Raf kinase inhibitor-like protein [Nitrososphaerota archaeon]|nr:YbhB/YbcL family Raf kinase inhibitor-like protein [Nitrososphaerota archaeon]